MATNVTLQFKVHEIHNVGQPVPHNVFNEFDQHGLLLNLERLHGEGNFDYRQRLVDVNVRKANSTYFGLVYGITRELGLDLFTAIKIQALKTNSVFKATNPVVVFRGPFVDLYSDYNTGIIDRTIDRWEYTSAYTLAELVTEINKSSYFEAVLGDTINPYTRSMTILNSSSRASFSESLPLSTQIHLKHKDILSGSMEFSSRIVFITEQTTLNNVKNDGDYYINYKDGIIHAFQTPQPGIRVTYDRIINPFTAVASPVIIQDIHSNFRDKLFIQNKDEFGTAFDGKPTILGTEIINELYSVYPEYWGE